MIAAARVVVTTIVLVTAVWATAGEPGEPTLPAETRGEPASRLVFATFAGTVTQLRSAEVLIDSIRRFGGRYSQAPITVVVDESESALTLRTDHQGVRVLPLEMDSVAQGFLFAQKVYAAAQVERLVDGEIDTLVWMDPETLVLKEPRALDLGNELAVAMRPVFLVNTIGLAPDAPLDGFWSAIYRETGADPAAAPTVEAYVEGTPMRFYINCGIIAYRPSKGICREWARAFTAMLKDQEFRQRFCADVRHRIFLHQSVLSAVILARTGPQDWRWLPNDHGYPLGQQSLLSGAKRVAHLEDLTCLIYDTLWATTPDWMSLIDIDEPLRSWISNAYGHTFQLGNGFYREEHSCNTYLVRTAAGDVVIDPGSASDSPGWLEGMRGDAPLRAILLTHGHEDHRGAVSRWKAGGDLPVIAQRRLPDLLAEQDRIAPFLERRNAIIAGKPVPAEASPVSPTPVEVTVFFDDRYELEVGGMHFQMIHTPGETPDTSTVWIPELRAAMVADDFFGAFPNLSTLRGNRTRWALEYAAAMDTILALEPEMILPGHGEPVVGKNHVRSQLTRYRDAILHVHDAVVAGINQGRDVYSLMRDITLPAELELPQYFGRVSWCVRGIYEGYLGWFDGNPASMYDRPASSVFPDLVTLAGGTSAITARAQELLAAGDAVAALQLTDVALAAAAGDREGLTVRLAALKALRAASRNYFEARFLNDAIASTTRRLEAAEAPKS